MNHEWNIFFKIVPLAFNTFIPVSFLLAEPPLKHLLNYNVQWNFQTTIMYF